MSKHRNNKKANIKTDINWNALGLGSSFPNLNDLYKENKNYTLFNFTALDKSSKKKRKKLSGGKVDPDTTPFNYSTKHKRPKTYHVNNQVPRKQTVTTPKGTKWVNITANVAHKVTDYENTDVYSNFDGWFNLEKIGNKFRCWVTLKNGYIINNHGMPVHKINGYDKPLVDKTWVDEDGNKSFALSSVAAYFAKHNIYEDNADNSHGTIIYHDVNMGCRSIKYWNILDGGNNESQPHIIAHKGENIIIDTGKMKVYNTDGHDLTKYTSFESSFPPLFGGQINNIGFYPTVGKDCSVQVTYIPRIK